MLKIITNLQEKKKNHQREAIQANINIYTNKKPQPASLLGTKILRNETSETDLSPHGRIGYETCFQKKKRKSTIRIINERSNRSKR